MRALKTFLRRQPRIELAYHTLRTILRGRGDVPEPTRHGFRMAGNEAITSGDFEPQEVDVLRELLPQHDRFIDI